MLISFFCLEELGSWCTCFELLLFVCLLLLFVCLLWMGGGGWVVAYLDFTDSLAVLARHCPVLATLLRGVKLFMAEFSFCKFEQLNYV